eukprot:scaffold16144_cov30-Tisochrysis_lutea.AAC.4
MLSRSRSLTPSCGACQCPISGESKLLFVQLPSALPVRPCTATSSSSPSGDDQVSATEYMAALARGSDDDHPGTAAAGAVKSANGPPSSGGYAAGGAAPGAPPLATLEELYEEQEGELLVYRSGKVSSLLYLGPLLPASHNALITQLDGAFAAIIVKPIAARRETMETDAITEPSTPLAGGTDRDADDATSKLRKAEKAEATAKTDPPMVRINQRRMHPHRRLANACWAREAGYGPELVPCTARSRNHPRSHHSPPAAYSFVP